MRRRIIMKTRIFNTRDTFSMLKHCKLSINKYKHYGLSLINSVQSYETLSSLTRSVFPGQSMQEKSYCQLWKCIHHVHKHVGTSLIHLRPRLSFRSTHFLIHSYSECMNVVIEALLYSRQPLRGGCKTSSSVYVILERISNSSLSDF